MYFFVEKHPLNPPLLSMDTTSKGSFTGSNLLKNPKLSTRTFLFFIHVSHCPLYSCNFFLKRFTLYAFLAICCIVATPRWTILLMQSLYQFILHFTHIFRALSLSLLPFTFHPIVVHDTLGALRRSPSNGPCARYYFTCITKKILASLCNSKSNG